MKDEKWVTLSDLKILVELLTLKSTTSELFTILHSTPATEFAANIRISRNIYRRKGRENLEHSTLTYQSISWSF